MKRLTPSQKRMLTLLGFVLLGAFLFQGSVVFFEARSEARSKISRRVEDLERLSETIAEYEALKAEQVVWIGALQDGGPVGSYLERIASDLNLSSRVQSINDESPEAGERLLYEPSRLRMRGLTLEEIVDFLYAVEARRSDLQIRRLMIRLSTSDNDRLDLNMVVARVQLKESS